MKPRLTAFSATLAALVALGLSGATAASALTLGHAGGLKYVRAKAPLPLAGFEELQAACGGSWHVLGGGAQISGPTISGQLESTAPFDGDDGNAQPDDGWLGAASNLGSVPQALKTYAICSQTDPEYGDITAQTGAVHSISGAGIGCDAPPWTVGGGIRSLTAPGNTHLVYTDPNSDLAEWEGAVYQDAGPTDAEFRVYAVCAAGMDLTWRHESLDAESTPTSVEVSAHCTTGTHVTGGGIQLAGTVATASTSWINGSRPFDGNDPGHIPDDGWTGRAQLGAGADGATASAVCEET